MGNSIRHFAGRPGASPCAGLEISRVGLGSASFGGSSQAFVYGGPQSSETSVQTIHHAVERGINWVDTAPVYGHGAAERIVGRALAELPEDERPYVFTKCGMTWDEHDHSAPAKRVGDPVAIRKDVESSLGRLGVERLDLCQMHHQPDDGTPVEEYWGVLEELRREGKIGAAALSNHDVDTLDRAQAIAPVAAVQTAFSAIDRLAATDVLPWCAGHGTAVLIWGSMHCGLLTGPFLREGVSRFRPDDWRLRDPDFTERLEANRAVAAALEQVAQRHATSVAAVAIAWVLAWPGVSAAVVGGRTPSQVDGWIDAPHIELDRNDLDTVGLAIERSGAGQGPVSPGASYDGGRVPLSGMHTSGRAHSG